MKRRKNITSGAGSNNMSCTSSVMLTIFVGIVSPYSSQGFITPQRASTSLLSQSHSFSCNMSRLQSIMVSINPIRRSSTIPCSQYSSSRPQLFPSSQSLSQTFLCMSEKSLEERAGTSGYSILRRPLNWDVDGDPRFDAPSSLDESKDSPQQANADWFGSRASNRRSELPQKNTEGLSKEYDQNRNDNAGLNTRQIKDYEGVGAGGLDLFQRTLDTLDYPVVLQALSKECVTVPAKRIIQLSLCGAKDPDRERKKERSKRETGHSSGVDPDMDIVTMGLTATSVEGVHRRYAALKEMKHILEGYVQVHDDDRVLKNERISSNGSGNSRKGSKLGPPPFAGATLDIHDIFEMADEGNVLEGPEILEISSVLDTLSAVSDWCLTLSNVQKRNEKKRQTQTREQYQSEGDQTEVDFVELPRLGKSIYVDPDLQSLLTNAFDEEGKLSGDTFPSIARLRSKVRTLKSSILTTLDTLLSAPSTKNKLSLESGGAVYSEVNGRIVIPVSDKYKNSVGIVHDASRSGKTSYVEPTEIVGPTNEMRQAEVELKQEESRIWRMLTQEILNNREDIERGVHCLAQLDLVLGRISLGEKLAGVVPEVGDKGIIQLKSAKHPVLLLRELENVVGNDIDIGDNRNQGLVLTGPNSGGKTVILKLMGLVALMARDGIPIPAQPDNARVDFFGPVLADIGDIQSVDGDLSTFSGHMLVCREVLANSKKNALVLMDELGSGTDPNQGVAIAQAILEALLETGARVGVTTHYLQLKQLASSDDRFSVAGMQFVNGRPTYKLLPGVVGESFALAVAERLNLPSSVLQRANDLLDSETRQMGDLIRDMEDQKDLIDAQAKDLEKKQEELKTLEMDLRKEQEKLERVQLTVRRNEARKFAKILEEKEQILEEILAKLKSDPSKKLVARSWDEIKYVKRDALTEAENIPGILRRKQEAAAAVANIELVPLSELREKPKIKPGDILTICKKGSFHGKEAKVVNVGVNRIDVSIGGMGLTMKINELSLPIPSSVGTSASPGRVKNNEKYSNLSKMARKALADEESEISNDGKRSSIVGEGSNNNEVSTTMRLKSNTVDVLGCTFDEARRKCENKFSRVMTQKNPVVYILHGHGNQGVLKQKVRDWLRRDKQWVRRFRPADISDGGDAFTQVELKKVEY